jgi:hypothetical protein
MGQVGNSSVANEANTTDGYALGVGAMNVPVTDGAGENVGDGGVVDLYHNSTPVTTFYIADETSPGLVLQEDDSKIILESA